MSLLGLINPLEFFVTVDKTTLWRSHVAWAKPNGKEIRDYTTQQFASNIVFLSLLLGSEMAVFLNASSLLTQIRKSMEDQDYWNLKYYIGCIIIVDICVTLLGLVATFTAWSMIAALSDSNSHAILRSSMGQYVTSLPMRFVVASLYLFLLWIVLLIMTLMKGPVPYLIVATVGFMFFQMVSSLSCFGRLIIHTGAMGQKRVLDPEFERHLLPSGLHASLLIKATERARRCTSATAQYQKNTTNNHGAAANKTSNRHRSNNTSPIAGSKKDNDIINNDRQHYMPPLPPTHGLRCSLNARNTCRGGGDGDGSAVDSGIQNAPYCTNDDDEGLSEEDHSALLLSARAFGSNLEWDNASSCTSTQSTPLSQQQKYHPLLLSYGATATATPTTGNNNAAPLWLRQYQHQRDLSSETVESCDALCHDVFPRPSVLNRVCTTHLKSVVKQVLDKTSQPHDQQKHLCTMTGAAQQQQQGEKSRSMRNLAKERQEASVQGLAKSTAVAQLCQEWTEEEQVRNLYGYDPPVQIDLPLSDSHDDLDNEPSDFKMMPRISLLNRSTRLQSLRNLLTFRGSKVDNIDDTVDTPGEDHHDQTRECIDGHVWLSYVEERGEETESSTRDSMSSRNSTSSEMDAAADDDANNITSSSCSRGPNKNKGPNSLPSPGNNSGSALSTMGMENSTLSADRSMSSSNTTPLLQNQHGQDPSCNRKNSNPTSLLYDTGDEDEETGTIVERQHLLSAHR
jgi:hypothetical protein